MRTWLLFLFHWHCYIIARPFIMHWNRFSDTKWHVSLLREKCSVKTLLLKKMKPNVYRKNILRDELCIYGKCWALDKKCSQSPWREGKPISAYMKLPYITSGHWSMLLRVVCSTGLVHKTGLWISHMWVSKTRQDDRQDELGAEAQGEFMSDLNLSLHQVQNGHPAFCSIMLCNCNDFFKSYLMWESCSLYWGRAK